LSLISASDLLTFAAQKQPPEPGDEMIEEPEPPQIKQASLF
jgi:hypothetical protein